MDAAALHRRTVEHWQRALDEVRPDDWARATPCADWTVRDLVNHVVGEELWTVPLVRGATIADVGDQFDGDVLGDDPLGRGSSAAGAAVEAVDEQVPKGGKVHLSYGDEDMTEYVLQLSADHLVHGWDLAVAVGADARMDPALVEAVGAWFRDREDVYRSVGAVGERPVITGESSSAQTELLATFGRDAHWT